MKELIEKIRKIEEPFSFHTDREGMLQRRKKGFGSTDWAPLLSSHPYRKSLEVIMDKKTESIVDDAPLIAEVGSHMESFIRAKFYQKNDYGCSPLIESSEDKSAPGEYNLIPHAVHPFLYANVDDLAISKHGSCVVEIKNVSSYVQKQWAEIDPPRYHWIQCQAHMAILGSHFGDDSFDHCLLVGMLNNRDTKVFLIQRDDAFISQAIDLLGRRWNMVQEGDVSDLMWELEGDDKTLDAVKAMYPGKEGLEADVADMEPDAAEYIQKSGELKELEKEVKQLKARIAFSMGNAVKGTAGGFKISYPIIKGRERVDVEVAMVAHPEIDWASFNKRGKDFRGGLRISFKGRK